MGQIHRKSINYEICILNYLSESGFCFKYFFLNISNSFQYLVRRNFGQAKRQQLLLQKNASLFLFTLFIKRNQILNLYEKNFKTVSKQMLHKLSMYSITNTYEILLASCLLHWLKFADKLNKLN